uniref:Reverse transcriptase domain-containing protein n=1 Tax=Clytia hemisphaerica TaxID=252671 RepID=A0A7M5VD07_9CNID
MYFVDTRLPFGLRSSPAIFNSFTDVVHWILQNKYKLQDSTHYSDDFLFVHEPSLQKARLEVQTALSAFQHLGIPTADDKTEGPACQLTYLGIEIDSSKQIIRIPNDKYSELMESLPFWILRRKCTKKELLSFIGKLSLVCKVVRPGRIFLRRLMDISMSVKKLHYHITLNSEARADIQWWIDFLPTWNKTSIIPDPFTILSSDIKLHTDASNIGLGAIYRNAWIQAAWPIKFSTNKQYNIDFKELITIVIASFINLLNVLGLYCEPLSETSSLGMPCLEKICFNTSITVNEFAFDRR